MRLALRVSVVLCLFSLVGCDRPADAMVKSVAKGVLPRISPADLAEEVALDAQIVLRFPVEIDPTTVAATRFQVTNTRTGELASGSVQVVSNDMAVSFAGNAPWQPDTFYLIKVWGIRGPAAEFLDGDAKVPGAQPFKSSFRTTAGDRQGPRVVQITPAEFGVITAGSRIVVSFDEPIQSNTVSQENLRLFDERGTLIVAESIVVNPS